MVEINPAIRAQPTGRMEAVPPPSAAQPSIGQGVADVAEAAKEIAGAQLEIWKLQATRVGALAGFGILGLVLTVALVIYGFGLLDTALAIALANTSLPAWFSPLVRGALYFGVPVAGMLMCWHMFVGWGSTDEKDIRASQAKGE